MRHHQPAAIVYDIALPYEANWSLFEHIRAAPACAGIPFILTSTNEAQVKKIAGSNESILEIVGKPDDLGKLLDQVVAVTLKH